MKYCSFSLYFTLSISRRDGHAVYNKTFHEVKHIFMKERGNNTSVRTFPQTKEKINEALVKNSRESVFILR